MRKVFSVAGAVALAAGSLLAGSASADAGSYSYVSAINCGTLSGVRQASLVAGGTYTAKLSGSGYSIKWSNHKSTLSYTACGKAAPYGSYPVNATTQKLTTQLKVTSAKLQSCTVGAKSGVSQESGGAKTSVGVEASCTFTSGTAQETLTTSGVRNKAASVSHGATVEIAGTYCNAASLYVKGEVVDTSSNFNGLLTINKKVYAC